VTAAVEQHHITRRSLFEGFQHRIDTDAAAGLVIVGVGFNRQSGTLEDRKVIGPGGVADPDGGLGIHPHNQLSTDAQGAGTAGGKHRAHAIVAKSAVPLTQDELDHAVVIGLDTHLGDIGLGIFLPIKLLFSRLDGAHHRGLAVLGFVDPDTKVNFEGARVLPERGSQAKNGIGGKGFQGVEHRSSLNSLMAASPPRGGTAALVEKTSAL